MVQSLTHNKPPGFRFVGLRHKELPLDLVRGSDEIVEEKVKPADVEQLGKDYVLSAIVYCFRTKY